MFKKLFIDACKNGNLDVAKKWYSCTCTNDATYYMAFKDACCYGHIEVCKWLLTISPKINISADNEYTFKLSCCNGHLNVAKWLLSVSPTINISDSAFISACVTCHLDVAKWLLSVKPNINISADNEAAFRWTCTNGHLEVAKWLLTVKPNINIFAHDEWVFKMACCHGNLDVAKWLQKICPDKYQIIQETPTILYNILTPLNKSTEIVYLASLDNCPICDESLAQVATQCRHMFCEPCLQKWLQTNTSCPCCRGNLKNTVVQPVSNIFFVLIDICHTTHTIYLAAYLICNWCISFKCFKRSISKV